jgi:hypothetical protein
MHTPAQHEVETFSGKFVDTKNPNPDTIYLKDIAHALANTCRYGGHCLRFYSVAEHSVFVSRRLERRGYSRETQLAGLHHDDAEAYLGDIPRPMKSLLGASYQRLTARMDEAIIVGLGLPQNAAAFHLPEVKDADNWSLFVEARFLLPSQGKHWFEGEQGSATWDLDNQPKRIVVPDYWMGGLAPYSARQLYLNRHKELTT